MRTNKVFEGIDCTRDMQSDAIVEENVLNFDLSKPNAVIPMSKNKLTTGGGTKFKSFNFQKRGTSVYTRMKMPLSHCVGKNFWILKATNLNRGRGIHVFNDLESLKNLIKEEWNCDDDADDKGKQKTTPNAIGMMIIQKYIERPLLVYKRKFDIRVWVMVSSTGKWYFFKEGYLRTSGSEFKLDPDDPDNQYVHLTNNAIQKNSKSYGQFEDGNQLSYDKFQAYLDEFYPEKNYNFRKQGLPRIKEIIKHSLLSVRRKLNANDRQYWFELFGYDFIMDDDFNIWLIEVNTNPWLEESSNMLKFYLRRMIEDMMKIEIDSKFAPPKKHKKSEKKKKNNTEGITNDQGNKKNRKSAGFIIKKSWTRKLSFTRASSFEKSNSSAIQRKLSKSSVSKRMTSRKTEDDSLQPAEKTTKASHLDSFVELKNELSKDVSDNSKDSKNVVKEEFSKNKVDESLKTF